MRKPYNRMMIESDEQYLKLKDCNHAIINGDADGPNSNHSNEHIL